MKSVGSLKRSIFILSISALFALAPVYAVAKEAVTAGIKPVPNSLPLCIDDETKIAEILTTVKANSKTGFKYDGYKKALASITDLELFARLIYSEATAANCEKQISDIIPLIGETIGNRIRIRKGDIGSVVYQRDQFASSLNNYPESHLRHFLCPKNATAWKQSLSSAQKALDGSTPVLPADTVNYYLYKHSTRFTPPDWKLTEATVQGGALAGCIRFFRNDRWK